MSAILNISAYKFVALDDLQTLRRDLKAEADRGELKGTILLASEGINLFVAGDESPVREFLQVLASDPRFCDLPIKESWSDRQPFNRMLVKLKKEIIPFGVDSIDPSTRPGQKINPATLKAWLDEGREITLLDTRNRYEIALGTFESAVDLHIDHFRDFPERVAQLPEATRDKPLVMFCTGGIRCEKAAPFVEQAGFREVYQLDGGILRYFEHCGGTHWQGDCFVFDDRVAVRPDLSPSGASLCYACQHPLTADDVQSDRYRPGESCPYCWQDEAARRRSLLAKRQRQIDRFHQSLPGEQPYNNARPIRVGRHLAGQTLREILAKSLPGVDVDYWQVAASEGRLRLPPANTPRSAYEDPEGPFGEIVSLDRRLAEGVRIDHWQIGVVEPPVSTDIRLLDEDDWLIAVDKPSALPVHESGRFRRNTLHWMLSQIYKPEQLRVVHRLDGGTSGVIVLARRYRAARQLQDAFSAGDVEKVYRAWLRGRCDADEFVCDAPIARECGIGGRRDAVEAGGKDATTHFRVLLRDENRMLVEVRPLTGRTNQIRIHAAAAGFPIENDPMYPDKEDGENRFSVAEEPDPHAPNEVSLAAPRLMLHAWQLRFRHPITGQLLTYESLNPLFEPQAAAAAC